MSKKTFPLLSLTAENRSKTYLLRYKSLFKGSKFRSLSMLLDSDLHSQYGSGSRAAKWMRFRYLLLILTIVNMYSYAIVLFQLENLRTSISGTRQRISEVLGMMTTVGSMRPSLTTTSFKLAVWTPDWLRVAYPYGTNFPLLSLRFRILLRKLLFSSVTFKMPTKNDIFCSIFLLPFEGTFTFESLT
jgi:hypothetical protein